MYNTASPSLQHGCIQSIITTRMSHVIQHSAVFLSAKCNHSGNWKFGTKRSAAELYEIFCYDSADAIEKKDPFSIWPKRWTLSSSVKAAIPPKNGPTVGNKRQELPCQMYHFPHHFQVQWVRLQEAPWTIFKTIQEEGRVGSRNRHRNWAQCWPGVIHTEDRRRGWNAKIWRSNLVAFDLVARRDLAR